MLVPQRRVAVPMSVGLARRIVRPMGVPVVLVMDVPVLVLERLVDVFVVVLLREVQIDAQGHEPSRHDELPGDRVPE